MSRSNEVSPKKGSVSGQEPSRTVLPLDLVARKILPFFIERLSDALIVALLCRHTAKCVGETFFWEPFLRSVHRDRLLWLRKKGLDTLASVMASCYEFWPPNMTVMQAVRSKFEFEEFPEGFPHAFYLQESQQQMYAISEDQFQGSILTADFVKRVAVLQEYAFTSCIRNVYLQPSSCYTRDGWTCQTTNGRDFGCCIFPSLVRMSGTKSSRGSHWSRTGEWIISSPKCGFEFRGTFDRKLSLDAERTQLVSEGSGTAKLQIDGEIRDLGLVRVFNSPEKGKLVPDIQARALGFQVVDIPERVYFLEVLTGAVKLADRLALELVDAYVGSPLWKQQALLQVSDNGLSGPVLVEVDHKRSNEAAYVCWFPEGSFSAEELVDRFGQSAIDAIAEFDLKNETPQEVECVVGERKGKLGQEYLVRWAGYPDIFNTWEPRENLGDDADIFIEDFRQSSVGEGDGVERAEAEPDKKKAKKGRPKKQK